MSRPSPLPLAVGAMAVVVLALGAWYVWQSRTPALPLEPLPPPAQQAEAPAAATSAPEPASAPSARQAPPPQAAAGTAPIAEGDEAVTAALSELFGRTAVLTLLQTDGFAARVVATVDNLPRAHVAPRLWPLNPTPGRFTVEPDGRIGVANALRYDAALSLLDRLPPPAAAAFHRRLSPQLQSAYEALGYPGQSFRDRLRAVIDHLLEAPRLSRPVTVALTAVKGPIPSERPWVRYEYTDPLLEQLSAGQRLLLRLGPARQQRVMDWLAELRPLL